MDTGNSTDDAEAGHQDSTLLREQLRALHEETATVAGQLHDLEVRWHQQRRPLDSPEGQQFLTEQLALVQQWRGLLQEEQELLARYRDVLQRHAAQMRERHGQ